MKHFIARLGNAALVLSMAFFVFPLVSNADVTARPGGSTPAVLERISGADRMETAVQISNELYPDDHTKKYAVLVSGESHADALAAGPLATLKSAPLLLSNKSALPESTMMELDRILKTDITATAVEADGNVDPIFAATVIIVGGESAVSAQVEQEIKDIREDIDTMRIQGADRYDTALEVALYMDQIRGYSSKWAFLANGEAYADAMAASAIASDKTICPDLMPILLTRTDSIPDSTAQYLGEIALTSGSTPTPPKLEKVYVLGGEARVSTEVFNYVDQIVDETIRVAGPNRYGTAANLAETFWGAGNPASKIGVARGDDFADALAAGPFMGNMHGPMLLVEPAELPDETYAYLLGHKDDIYGGWVLGGVEAVSNAVKGSVESVYMDL